MEKEGIHINGIYRHYKGNYYLVKEVAFNHEFNTQAVVIYNQCDINGVYKSIRDKEFVGEKFAVSQPFYRDINEFKEIVNTEIETNTQILRFKFIKLCS